MPGTAAGKLCLNGKWRLNPPNGGLTDTAVAFAADVADGEAVVMVMPEVADRKCLIVAESVKVPANCWRQFSRAYRAKEWITLGPKPLLDVVERSARWTAGIASPIVKPSPKWTQTLSDGTQVSLLGLSQQTRWPFVWWTADGLPLRYGRGHWPTRSPQDEPLVAVLRVVPPKLTKRPDLGVDLEWIADMTRGLGESQLYVFPFQPSSDDRRLTNGSCVLLAEPDQGVASGRLQVGIGIGEWQPIGELRPTLPLTIAEGTCEVQITESNQRFTKAKFTRPIKLTDRQLTMVAVSKSGERHYDATEHTERPTSRKPDLRFRQSELGFRLPLTDLSHFEVESRPIESALFTDFATEPAGIPLIDQASSNEPTSATAKSDELSNDARVRFANASADVAKAEWDKMHEANRKVPGVIPTAEVDRLRRAYLRALLKAEQAEHAQRFRQW